MVNSYSRKWMDGCHDNSTYMIH